jgi:hypothetical protein
LPTACPLSTKTLTVLILRFAAGREEDKADPFSYLAFVGGRHGMSWADIYIHAGQLSFLKQIIFKSQERLIKNLTSGGEY